MIVNGATTLRSLMRDNAVEIAAAVAVVVVVQAIDSYVDFIRLHRAVFSMAALGLLTTALSIFLVFRVNEAYARWWEARTLWGGLVNASRSFARQATTLLNAETDDDEVRVQARELVYRHVAYVNALRIHLRRESSFQEIAEWIPPDEFERLETAANKPTQLIEQQARQIERLRRRGLIDGFAHIRFDDTLTELFSLQGGCERIKNTVFPDRVAYFTRVIAWAMAVLIPICVLEGDETLDLIDLLVVPSMMLTFIITERFGAELKNPFEGRPNDTPMTALCRTIEIDLRQQLGEHDVPEPLSPVRGVLL